MKKNSFKKVIASLAALSVVAVGTAAVPVSAKTLEANQTDSEVYVDRATVSVDEAKAGVPIYVRLNIGDAFAGGMTNFEFGVDVDSRASRVFINDAATALEFGGENLNVVVTPADSPVAGYENYTYMSFAKGDVDAEKSDIFAANKITGVRPTSVNVAMVYVTIADPQPGETYPITIETKGVGEAAGRELTFKNGNTILSTDDIQLSDGWIKIEGEPETTAPETTTTEAETTKAEETTTQAEETTTEAEETTTTVGGGEDDGTTTTTTGTGSGAGGNGTSTSTTTGTDKGKGDGDDKSPETGVSDVLPIAGVAAAVAVLGGVALATKKKND